MVEEIATVVTSDEQGVWLQTKAVSSCNACQARDSCTSGVVAKHLTSRDYRFFLPHHQTTVELIPGQQVRIGLMDDILVQSALLVYLLPLLMFIAGVGVAMLAGATEGWQLMVGLLTGAAGMALARWRSNTIGTLQQQVQVLAILPQLAVKNH